jgi:AraC family transcriptional regulator of arabinose operon
VGSSDQRIAVVVATLRSEWHREIRIADLCALAGLGVSRLEALFKAEMRVSMRDFLHAVRLEKAAELIATTYERISQIAYSVGFRDVPNFNHAFKKRYGLAPKAYRRRHQTRVRAEALWDSYQESGNSPINRESHQAIQMAREFTSPYV